PIKYCAFAIAIMYSAGVFAVYCLSFFGMESRDLADVEQLRGVVGFMGPGKIVTSGILYAIIFPIAEEIFFRAGIFKALKAVTKRVIKNNAWRIFWAVAISSIFYAAAHNLTNLQGFIDSLIMGMVLAYAYQRSRTISVPISVHVIFDSLTFRAGTRHSNAFDVLYDSYALVVFAALLLTLPALFKILKARAQDSFMKALFKDTGKVTVLIIAVSLAKLVFPSLFKWLIWKNIVPLTALVCFIIASYYLALLLIEAFGKVINSGRGHLPACRQAGTVPYPVDDSGVLLGGPAIPGRSPKGPSQKKSRAGIPSIHQISYYLDQVKYVADQDIMDALDNNELPTFLDDPWFFVQNHRGLEREEPCSGGCFYCYARTVCMQKRREAGSPMDLSEAEAIVAKAIAMGFRVIQVNGSDTLQDLDSFFAIANACKGKNVELLFFTNGFYFLEHPGNALAFFQRLKEAVGGINVGMSLSWDPGKVNSLMRWPQFRSNSDRQSKLLVMKAMAGVIRDYRAVFSIENDDGTPPNGEGGYCLYPLVIEGHDMATDTNPKQVFAGFSRKLRHILKKEHGFTENSFKNSLFNYTSIDWSTYEAYAEGVRRGRAALESNFTVDGLIDRMWGEQIQAKQKRANYYRPMLDMSTGELSACIRRVEYPRRAVSPENFAEVLAKPFSNPRSRRFYLWQEDEIFAALPRELEFAVVFNPRLRNAAGIPYEALESYIFSDEALMTKIELAFLLEDILFTASDIEKGDDYFHRLQEIPRELIRPLLDRDISLALLTSYLRFKEYAFPSILDEIAGDLKSDADMGKALMRMKLLLTDYVEPYLEYSGIISSMPAQEPPIGFLKTATVEPCVYIPGVKPQGQSSAGIAPSSEGGSRPGQSKPEDYPYDPLNNGGMPAISRSSRTDEIIFKSEAARQEVERFIKEDCTRGLNTYMTGTAYNMAVKFGFTLEELEIGLADLEEVFIKCCRRFKCKSSFKTYLYAAIHNLIFNALQNRRREALAVDLPASATTDGLLAEEAVFEKLGAIERDHLASDISARELILLILKAIQSISPKLRQVAILRMKRIKYTKIADLLGIPEDTVRSRIYAAKIKINEKIGILLAKSGVEPGSRQISLDLPEFGKLVRNLMRDNPGDDLFCAGAGIAVLALAQTHLGGLGSSSMLAI
ncbi:MAG: sigma-70 family RNA polymerase sigma factor, partial [Candidatus Omnitrophota bacterium]